MFTRGDKGDHDPGMTPERLAALREAEQRAAAAILGVQRLSFLDFKDGELAWAGSSLAAAGLAPVREILLIMSDHADHVADIASTFARKVQAVRAPVAACRRLQAAHAVVGGQAGPSPAIRSRVVMRAARSSPLRPAEAVARQSCWVRLVSGSGTPSR